MLERGRNDYYACVPFHKGPGSTLWSTGWTLAAEQAALELQALRARLNAPPMVPAQDLSPPLFMLILLIAVLGTAAAVYFAIKEGVPL